ncbi:MAG: hypothetical protein Kow00104_20860 [Rhodothalassiaceae bacterium]
MAKPRRLKKPSGEFFSQRGRAVPAPVLRQAQLDHLVRQVPMMALVSFLVVLIVLMLLGDRTTPLLGFLWGAAIIVPSMINLVRCLRYRKSGPLKRPVSRRQMRTALFWSIYMGLAWGATEFLFFEAGDTISHIVLAFVTVGMAAGMVASLTPIPAQVFGFCLGAVPPSIVCMLTRGSPEELAVGTLLMLFLAALGVTTMNGYAQFKESLAIKQRLRSAMTHLEDAIENTGEALAIFDRDGRLVLANALYREFFPEGPSPVSAGEEPCIHKLEDGRWVRTTIRPTLGGGKVAVHADITELKTQERELDAARIEAESASQAKSQFLAVMSHELRTPLNSIIGFAELIARRDIPTTAEKMRDYAGFVLESGRHLLGIISDILDLSRIEAKRYVLREENVFLDEILSDLAKQLAPQAKAAGVEVALDIADIPDLWGETRAMRQIFTNLLANAIKFTERGGRIEIRAQCEEDGLAIAVADSGIGIPADQVDKVFEPFQQVDSALAREHQGTGLGLPLVRRLVELHGGSVVLQSEPGKGTVVTVRLPQSRLLTDPRRASVAVAR